MSKVVRFRKLKHGDPPRFKVLPEELTGRSSRRHSTAIAGSFPIMVLVLVGIAAVVVVGGLIA
jgi:hypothetical protein